MDAIFSARWSHSSLGSRFAIYIACLRIALQRGRRPPVDGKRCRLLRQRHVRELLCNPWNASCSRGAAFIRRPRPVWRYSRSLSLGIIRTVRTPRSTICRRSTSSGSERHESPTSNYPRYPVNSTGLQTQSLSLEADHVVIATTASRARDARVCCKQAGLRAMMKSRTSSVGQASGV